jgi:ATP-dependent DNA helicase RecG
MVILSYPGPDRSVRLEQLRLGRAMSRRYRNRRSGEFLRELNLTEGRSSGIPKILRAMKLNGSLPPEFEFDEDHSYFLARLPVSPDVRKAAGKAEMPESDARPESGGESGLEPIAASKMAVAILMALAQKPLGKQRIAEHLENSDRHDTWTIWYENWFPPI